MPALGDNGLSTRHSLSQESANITDWWILGVLHSFCRFPFWVPFNSLNTKLIASALGNRTGVCNNLICNARKLLILKTERCPSG